MIQLKIMHLEMDMKLEDDKIHSPTNTEEEGYGSDVEVENGTDISGSKGGSGVELKRPDLKGL